MIGILAHELIVMAITQVVFSTILFCIAWTVTSVLVDRLPHLRLILWLAVVLRLLVPTDLFTPFSIGAIVSELRPRHTVEMPVVRPSLSPAPMTAAHDLAETNAPIWPLALSIVWLGGFMVFFCRWHRGRERHLESLRSGEERPTAALLDIVEDWKVRLGIRRSVRFRVSNDIATPFTFGVVQPTICLPAELLRRLESPQISMVIGHELGHVKRLDDLWLRLEAFIRCLYWFHPAVRVTTARLSEIREQLTDELTVRSGAIEGRRYAKTLLSTISLQKEPDAAPGFGAHSGRVLERRIRNLLEHRSSPHRALAVATGLAAGAFLLPMSLPASTEPSPGPPTERIVLDHPLPISRITSPFGPRRDPFSNSHDDHRGIDLAAPRGTRVLAPAAGTVIVATEMLDASPSQGSVIIIQHTGGLRTFYSHLDRILVESGETVRRGQSIGLVGATGRVTGPHLHFEVRTEDGPVDPSTMIPELRKRAEPSSARSYP